MTNEVSIPTESEYQTARKAWSDAHAGRVPISDCDHAWVAGYARSLVDQRLSPEPRASQLHDRENRCVLCHKYRNDGASKCANCGLDFSVNRNPEQK
jgi:hypothetical protein